MSVLGSLERPMRFGASYAVGASYAEFGALSVLCGIYAVNFAVSKAEDRRAGWIQPVKT